MKRESKNSTEPKRVLILEEMMLDNGIICRSQFIEIEE